MYVIVCTHANAIHCTTFHCIATSHAYIEKEGKKTCGIVARKLAYWSMHGNQKLLDVLAAQSRLQSVNQLRPNASKLMLR